MFNWMASQVFCHSGGCVSLVLYLGVTTDYFSLLEVFRALSGTMRDGSQRRGFQLRSRKFSLYSVDFYFYSNSVLPSVSERYKGQCNILYCLRGSPRHPNQQSEFMALEHWGFL